MPPSPVRLALLVTSWLAVAGCVPGRPSLDQLPSEALAGHYTGGPAGSWFLPCGAAPADSGWWVTFTDRAATQQDSLRRAGLLPAGERRFVRWLAAVIEDGRIGPRGPGVPALLVREIRAVQRPAADDCRS